MNLHGLRGGLFNPTIRNMVRNGECSPSSASSEVAGNRVRDYSDANIARKRYLSGFESLVYYFNDEWFDLSEQLKYFKETSRKTKMINQPSRCDKCNREFAIDSGEQYYLDDTFKRLPLQTDTCGECE